MEDPQDLIIIEDGDMFEGTREQFEDCFFYNATDDNIKDWCFDYDYKYFIKHIF